MKFRITMKDPDGPYECLNDEAARWADEIETLDEEERSSLLGSRRERLAEVAGKWMQYGEYLTVEFDTEDGSAVVVKTK